MREKGGQKGRRAFDCALFDEYRGGQIRDEGALKKADSKNSLRLRNQLSEGKTIHEEDLDDDDESGDLSLMARDSTEDQMF